MDNMVTNEVHLLRMQSRKRGKQPVQEHGDEDEDDDVPVLSCYDDRIVHFHSKRLFSLLVDNFGQRAYQVELSKLRHTCVLPEPRHTRAHPPLPHKKNTLDLL